MIITKSCNKFTPQERQEDLKSAINIASKISPSERSSKAIETLEKAKSDLSSHCGDLEDKLNYRISLVLQSHKDLEMDANIEQAEATGGASNGDGKRKRICQKSPVYYRELFQMRHMSRDRLPRNKFLRFMGTN